MDKTYKIRIHQGQMETKYGVDSTYIVDDPNCPLYTEKEAITALMSKLDYIESEDVRSDYTGYWNGNIGAFFDYMGYIDVDIPESIVNKILRDIKLI